MSDQAIGVFDSGIGGLTVLKELVAKYPNENFLYLGDTARLPYGSKSPDIIRRYLEQALSFLKNQNVKALVVACNSASSQIRETEFQGIPVQGVIAPGAEAALANSKNNGCKIGLLGTRATISSRVYEMELARISEQQGLKTEVFAMAAPLFVPLAEEGWIDDPVTNLIIYRYVAPLLQHQIDTLILGCTHYPILRAAIQKVAGNSVTLVDSGKAMTVQIEKLLHSGKIKPATGGAGKIEILMTDGSPQFEKMAEQLLSPTPITSFEVVSI